MKILFVHNDKKEWAAARRGAELARHLGGNVIHCRELTDGDSYDVIHFLYSGGITSNKDFILKYRDKVFTTLASYRTLEGLWDKIEDLREIYTQTRCCVAQNKDLLQRYNHLFGENAVYIPNGVDVAKFSRSFFVGLVGARDSQGYKGLPMVMEACESLGLRLRIASDISYDKMPSFYESIDCLVLLSNGEGCNNPTLEALAMNIPVISTHVGIAEELEGVILVEKNVESLKKALRKLSSRIQIEESYNWSIIAKQYKKLYAENISFGQ